ncbi:peptide MFS transporter [Brevundimonas bullata]|uniref:peptide MFS transporter n=1 Tax=Brevundimonas bullata TaxID=13160 RepID=UPI0019AA145E|nr:peptide MFS transporter [Brevundimonas sp.]
MSIAASEKSFLGQPRGLTVLFLTEMWEKFSFFGMRTLLVYYMTTTLLIEQGRASIIYGLYTAVIYLTPIFGGVLADHWLGRRRSVVFGASIMILGHFMMASEALFYPALAVIAIGNGLFLPNLPGQVAGLYKPDDPRRGSAYNIYYMGVNLGAFMAPLVCGAVGEIYGWHWGFALAGVGMAAGLAIYLLGGRYLPADPPRGARGEKVKGGGLDRSSLWLFGGVILAVVVFRVAYEQVGNTLALWIGSDVDRSLGDWSIPMTWFQSLNPLLVFLLTPILVTAWDRSARKGRGMSSLARMATGAALVAGAFFGLALVVAVSGQGAVHWLWLAAFFLLLTSGELFILPVGLGLFGRLAPAQMTATMIAAWFLAAFAGNLLAGLVGSTWSAMSPSGYFALMGVVASVAVMLLCGLIRPFRKLEA